jgi:hypothetical protein
MKPGDFLKFQDHIWRIRGIHLGALGVESIIEVENVSHKPGWTGEWETHQSMFIPEILMRQCQHLPANVDQP